MTGKSVVIDYVEEGDKTLLRVSTYYPDNEYDTNKPYVFTLDPGPHGDLYQLVRYCRRGEREWRDSLLLPFSSSSVALLFRCAIY